MKSIQVFEWESLSVDRILPGGCGESLSQTQFDSLLKWNDAQDGNFFKLGHKKITFTQWVGVIHIQDLCIEVIPKADKRTEGTRQESLAKWSSILMKMLRATGQIKLRTSESSSLALRKQSLLDIYLECFINEVETLIHRGMIKKYHKVSQNRTSLKGKLLFSQNIKHNLVHKERFFTQAAEYDKLNVWNEMLYAALGVVFQVTSNGLIRSRAKELELYFPDWPKRTFTAGDFDRLNYDRKSEGYREAIQLAKLILLKLNPQIQAGSTSVVAIFFDMNDLFERYVAKVLGKKILLQGLESSLYIKTQGPQQDLLVKKDVDEVVQKAFRLKPDMVVGKRPISAKDYVAILDTKWKSLDDSEKKMGVSQADLYQLYTYAGEYECQSVALIYPKWGEDAKAHHYEYSVGPGRRETRIQLVPFDCERDVFVCEEGGDELGFLD